MRVLKWIGAILFLLVVLLASACFVLSKKAPTGAEGDLAQRLALRVEQAVNMEGWRKVKAVSFGFRKRNVHLWDRARGLSRVVYGEGDDRVEVLLHVGDKRGIAFEGGKRVSGAREAELVQEGYSRWANDTFWLNPIDKLRDRGVSLKADPALPNALVVAFSSGGVTPGDTYRITLGKDGKPVSWDMWVQVLPVKGLSTSWEAWQQLPEGAWISTNHDLALGSVYLSDVKSGPDAASLNGGTDPFAPLLDVHPMRWRKPASAPAPVSAPASAPTAP